MTAPRPSVLLAAGTCTGSGTSVALAEACRGLSAQVAAGTIDSATVHIPAEVAPVAANNVSSSEAAPGAENANQSTAGLVLEGLDAQRRSRWAAIVEEVVGRRRSAVYIGFADRLPLIGRGGETQVMVVQNPHLYETSNAPSLSGLRRRLLSAWSHRSARSADLIICATEASRQAVLGAIPGLDPDRIVVRPIRPETPAPRASQPEQIQRVLLLGDLYTYKRFDVAVDAVRIWAQADHRLDVEVVHCGRPVADDPQGQAAFEAAADRARSAGLAVTLAGRVSHDAAMVQLRSSDLMVVASETETQGLTVHEALAVGVPVVARSIGAIQDIGGDALVGVPINGEVDDFAEAIGRIADQDVRVDLAERGIAHVSQRSPDDSELAQGWNLLPSNGGSAQ